MPTLSKLSLHGTQRPSTYDPYGEIATGAHPARLTEYCCECGSDQVFVATDDDGEPVTPSWCDDCVARNSTADRAVMHALSTCAEDLGEDTEEYLKHQCLAISLMASALIKHLIDAVALHGDKPVFLIVRERVASAPVALVIDHVGPARSITWSTHDTNSYFELSSESLSDTERFDEERAREVPQ